MRDRSEAGGSAVPFLVLCTIALLLVAGGLWEASARVRAYLRARDIAQAAAIAGAQHLDEEALHNGVLEVDRDAAVEEVRAYLASVGSQGRVVEVGSNTTGSSCGVDNRLSPPRPRSCVRVEVREHFGPGLRQGVTATGTARPVAGVREEEP